MQNNAVFGLPDPSTRRPPPPDVQTFHSLVAHLVKLNKRTREDFAGDHIGYPVAAYADYFSTVRAYAGRRSGATSYIRAMATKDDLIIVPNWRVEHEYQQGISSRVTTVDNIERSGAHRARYDTIFIDVPSLVFEKVRKDKLYYLLARDTSQTFILLGL